MYYDLAERLMTTLSKALYKSHEIFLLRFAIINIGNHYQLIVALCDGRRVV